MGTNRYLSLLVLRTTSHSETKVAPLVTASADLESFSAHASRPGRPTITADDVLLLARRNEDLHGLVKEAMDEVKEVREKRKAEKGKATKTGKTSKGKEKAK